MSEQKDKKQIWQEYCQREVEILKPILKELGFELDSEQPLIFGEKYLLKAVTTVSGEKLVLLGRKIDDQKRVVIKVAIDREGIKEIERERLCREALEKINFAYNIFLIPKEIVFEKKGERTIFIQEYIDSKISFFDLPIKKQFQTILKSFKAQEGAHATAYKHKKYISNTFGEKGPDDYLKMFDDFENLIVNRLSENKEIALLFEKSKKLLKNNKEIIDQYSGFLTHTDFVPHNFRIAGEDVYLLDISSLRFGNKHEGWARFLNFMTLYNRELEQAFLFYMEKNRTKEENLSLKLMRVYRLGEIISFYAGLLDKTSGNEKKLTEARIDLWSNILKSILNNSKLSDDLIEKYKKIRDSLRSEDEKKRQAVLY